jgi:Spy/CpxP family protein refolding chaperone
MAHRTRTLLIIFSLSLNLAFIGVWGSKTLTQPARAAVPKTTGCPKDSTCRVWCPLHRALGTTDAQWKLLEPRQREFQAASDSLSEHAARLREQLAVLLAAPVVDRAALDARQAEIFVVQKDMQQLVVNHLLDEKQVLTAEQQQKLFAMLRESGGCAGHRGMLGLGAGGKGGCPQKQSTEHAE